MLASSITDMTIHFSEFQKGTSNNWIIWVFRIGPTFPD